MEDTYIVSTAPEEQTEPTVSGVEDTDKGVKEEVNKEIKETVTPDNAQVDKFNDGDKFAKAFSKRFNKEKEKLTKEYEPFKKVVSIAAKQFGMSEEEYIQSIMTDYAEDFKDKPKTPEKDERDTLIEELLAEKKEKEIAQQWEKQARALQEIDARVSMESITDEMLSLSEEKGIPLEYIYAFEMLTSNREQFEKEIEEKLMAKINKVNKTAGSLTGNQVSQQTPSVNSMSAKDFNDLKERVKRGEKINF